MRDYWNDPPEAPEPPGCPNDPCKGEGEYLYDGKHGSVWSCGECGYQWVIPYPIDPEPPLDTESEAMPDDEPRPCPHGKIESCDACDFLGDIAYDTQREQRHFGR